MSTPLSLLSLSLGFSFILLLYGNEALVDYHQCNAVCDDDDNDVLGMLLCTLLLHKRFCSVRQTKLYPVTEQIHFYSLSQRKVTNLCVTIVVISA